VLLSCQGAGLARVRKNGGDCRERVLKAAYPSRNVATTVLMELQNPANCSLLGLFGGSRMARLSVLTFAALAVTAAPAVAEPGSEDPINALSSISRIIGEPPTQVERRGFSFPVVEYRGPDGVVQKRRGIIAGKQVAPGTVLGVGIYETAPKMRGYVGDVPQNMAPRKSRRAAVGLSVKF